MLLTYRGWAAMKRKLAKLKAEGIAPKVIVLAGKHEPLEPTARIVRRRIRVRNVSRPLHEHFDPNDALFIAVGVPYTPVGYYRGLYNFAKQVARRLGVSLFVGRRGLTKKQGEAIVPLERQRMLGEYLRKYIESAEKGKPIAKSFIDYLWRVHPTPSKAIEHYLRILRYKWKPEEDNTVISLFNGVFPRALFVNLHASGTGGRDEIILHPKRKRLASEIKQKIGGLARVKTDKAREFEVVARIPEILVELAVRKELGYRQISSRHKLGKAVVGTTLQAQPTYQIAEEYVGTPSLQPGELSRRARLVHKIVSRIASLNLPRGET